MFSIPKRHALVKRDVFYYFWRYVANSSRTRRAARRTPEFSDTPGLSAATKRRLAGVMTRRVLSRMRESAA